MNTRFNFSGMIVTAVGCLFMFPAIAGTPLKWEQVPEAVRSTVLANGGKVGSVDREGNKINGLAVYEAVGKDKQGNEVDLVITEDGKLVETKSDDAADREAERVAREVKALDDVKFSHPRDITHPFLPLATVKIDILEGKEDGEPMRVERSMKPDVHKKFKFGKQTIDSLTFEDRVFVKGKLEEVALDYFAQSDDGTVYYLGEDVDEYKDGKVVSHGGAWLLGKETKIPGVLLPANSKVGDKFRSEDVPNITTEDDEVLALDETVTVPAGTYKNCLKVREKLSDGKTEYKYYAKGVGCVKEIPADGELVLISHTPK